MVSYFFHKICVFTLYENNISITDSSTKQPNLLDLSDELIRLVLINLHIGDVLAVQETGNKRIIRVIHELNNHMLTQFQVAMWRMQSSLNFYDTSQFNLLPWPTHIIDLFVFYPIFADQTKFVRNFVTIYCPLATLFKQAPQILGPCFQLVDRAYAIASRKLTPECIVEFVNVAFAALERLKKMTDNERVNHPMRFLNLIRMVKSLTRKEYPNIMDYVSGLDTMRDKEMIVRKWFEREAPDSDCRSFVRQAIDRCRIFQVIMQNIESISLTCVSLKYITSGILYRLPNVNKLELELGSPHDIGPIIKYLSATNQISNLCIQGRRCVGIEYLASELFLPFRKFTELKTLWFCYCEFLTDGVLRNVLSNVQNVHTLGSLYNNTITAPGMIRALSQQHSIHTLEMNFCRIRVTHNPEEGINRMRRFCYFGLAVCFYILFMMMAVGEPFW